MKKVCSVAILSRYFYLAIFLIPLVFNPWGGVNPYEITKQSWLFALIGISFLFLLPALWLQHEHHFSIHRGVFFIFGLWVLSFLLSTIFSIAPLESFWGSYERMQGLFTHGYYGIHFLFCLQFFREDRFQKIFLRITLFCGLFVALYALLQKIGIDPIYQFSREVFPGRSFSTIGYPNGLGEFLIFPFFAAGFLGFDLWKKERLSSLLLLAMGITMLLAIFAAKNRASLLGIGIAVIIAFLLNLKGKKRVVFTVLTLLFAIVVLFFLFHGDLRSLGTRVLLWKSSLSLIPQYFFFGSGPETYYQTIQTVFPEKLYFFERITDIPDRAHNVLLDTFLTRGVVGLLLSFLNIIFLVYLLLRKKLVSVASKIAFFSILAYTVSVQFSFSLVTSIIFLIAMWAILLQSVFPWRIKKIIFRPPLKILMSIVLLISSYIAISASFHRIATDVLFAKAISAYFRSEKEALNVFSGSVNHSPQYGYLYQSIFIFFGEYMFEDKSIIPQLEEFAERFGKITNRSFHYDLAKAKLAVAKGDAKESERFFERARAKAPKWVILWFEWGKLALKNKDYNTAIEKFEKLLSLAPVYWKWKPTLSERPPEERERYRIFRISNQSFYEALVMLIESYKRAGRIEAVENLKQYL